MSTPVAARGRRVNVKRVQRERKIAKRKIATTRNEIQMNDNKRKNACRRFFTSSALLLSVCVTSFAVCRSSLVARRSSTRKQNQTSSCSVRMGKCLCFSESQCLGWIGDPSLHRGSFQKKWPPTRKNARTDENATGKGAADDGRRSAASRLHD